MKRRSYSWSRNCVASKGECEAVENAVKQKIKHFPRLHHRERLELRIILTLRHGCFSCFFPMQRFFRHPISFFVPLLFSLYFSSTLPPLYFLSHMLGEGDCLHGSAAIGRRATKAQNPISRTPSCAMGSTLHTELFRIGRLSRCLAGAGGGGRR